LNAAFSSTWTRCVSTGPVARAACASLGAEAYTLGNHVAVRGAASPWLVAHEIAHAVQQTGQGRDRGRSVGDPETDASRAATFVASGGVASVQASASPGIPQCFRLSSATRKDFPKATAYLRDEMPKVVNEPQLLQALVDAAYEGGQAPAGSVGHGSWVRQNAPGTSKRGLQTHQGSQS
jgi:hypothetical protein